MTASSSLICLIDWYRLILLALTSNKIGMKLLIGGTKELVAGKVLIYTKTFNGATSFTELSYSRLTLSRVAILPNYHFPTTVIKWNYPIFPDLQSLFSQYNSFRVIALTEKNQIRYLIFQSNNPINLTLT